MLEVQRATINTEAISRLDEIRASIGGAPGAPRLQGGAAPAIEGSSAATDTATTGPSFTKQAPPGQSGSGAS